MEETTLHEEAPQSWFKDAMTKGLILGAIHIVIFLLLYMLAPSKLTGFSYLGIIIVLNFGFSIYQGIKYRKSLGGYMDFTFAFKYAFIMLLFNGILNTVFMLIFVLVEPSLPDTMAQSQLDTSVYWAQKMGAPEESLNQIQEKYNPEDVTKRYKPLGLLMGLGFAAIFYAIGGLIIGLIVRKRQPEEFT